MGRNLNERQIEAITAPLGPVLVLAGAGSGKTTVLIERVAHLINEYRIKPWEILAITFTKKAAGEMKERLAQKLGECDIWAFTFHAACAKILRRDIDKLGYERDFTVYDSDDSVRVMKKCLDEHNLDDRQFVPRAVLSDISNAKNNGVYPSEFFGVYANESNGFRIEKIQELYKTYQRKLKSANALDFDDLLLVTVRLFNEMPDVLAYWQRRFKSLMVDEYQDTNSLQYHLCSMLSEQHNNLFVVGDDDQSIYRFRGATVQNILNFERQFPDAKVIRLEQNYRSTGNILNAANGVIANNTARKDKTLWTGSDNGSPVIINRVDDGSDEGAYISEIITRGIQNGAKYNNFAVLYRKNAQSGQIEDALRRRGIPYRMIGGTRFTDTLEIRDILAYLNVVNNPNDNLRLLRIINTPARGIGGKTIELLEYFAQGGSVWNVLQNREMYPDLTRSEKQLDRFKTLISELQAAVSDKIPMSEFYDLLLEKTGYLAQYQLKKDPESERRTENILEMRTNIAKYESEAGDSASLADFLELMALFEQVENYNSDADAAVLMTMHSAKGLEFDTVFLVGFEESVFPSQQAFGEPEELEEERRLCYVAITRARRELHILHANHRMMYGRTTHNPPSRFLDEIPESCTERIDPRPRRESVRVVNPRPGFGVSRKVSAPPINDTKLDLNIGENVSHRAFGNGVVAKVTPMGGDALIEIDFEGLGKKRLMQKAASGFLTKI